ncbi:uncharacterized protein LOC110635065 [Hevea brasiliensis]|uniref:uncharacterized protein LOC110635065 n=1 Tax=Hevea brasiliensis TaxID=3981 RepID=UPI0025F05D42|nr:uncharacterized protein LOC110635065 [Hevea brasiliensis]
MSQELIAASSSSSLTQTHASQFLTIKLTSLNHLLWQAQLLPLLRSHNLTDHVSSSATTPSPTSNDGSPNPQYINWFRRDQLVLSWLFCSISEALLPQIIGLKIALEAWTKLETIFASGTRTQIQQLRKQLKRLSKGSNSIDTYMRHAKSISDQLAALQSAVHEDALINDILDGLGLEYRPFIRALEARNALVHYDDLYALLLSEETQLNVDKLSLEATIPPTAQVANKTTFNGYHGGQSSRGGHRGRREKSFVCLFVDS